MARLETDAGGDLRLGRVRLVVRDVRELLSVYMMGQHFYNVVRAIDRRLYAPDWLRSALTT